MVLETSSFDTTISAIGGYGWLVDYLVAEKVRIRSCSTIFCICLPYIIVSVPTSCVCPSPKPKLNVHMSSFLLLRVISRITLLHRIIVASYVDFCPILTLTLISPC